MNRLVIIGNGFDMAHGLKTSYMDFINWYWEKRLNALVTENSAVSSDCLCDLEIKNTTECPNWFNFFYSHSFRNLLTGKWIYPPSEIIGGFIDNKDDFSVKCSIFFESIRHSIETKGWVDIENEYYQLLKRCTKNAECDYSVKELNEQLAYLQEKLVDYLRTIEVPEPNGAISKALTDSILVEDLSTEGKALAKTMGDIEFDTNTFDDNRYMVERFSGLSPERTMLLCFNYTGTAKMYEQYGGLILNYIHGELNDPEHIIFGYGDELDKDYQDILDRNDNELLKNVKSVKYLETRNYHMMLDFIMAAPFQVLIMGHSCGNSDRTLLNTVFEHENCVSIKPFYHKWEDGSDNYLELVQNISRNFTNMRLFRDRVVNKEQCQTM